MLVACDSAKVSIDVGSSRGRFTGWLGYLSNRVIAIDPNPAVLEFRNRWQFWWCDPQRHKTIYISAAVGDKQAIGTFREYKDSITDEIQPGLAGMLDTPINHKQVVLARETAVCIETIDSLVSQPVGFIKIDVEGYELHAIRGARRIIREHQPIIILETDISIPVIQELDSMGYDCWPLGWPLAGPITIQDLCLCDMLAVPKEKQSTVMPLIQAAVNPYVDYTANQFDTKFDYTSNVQWVSNHILTVFNQLRT